MKKAFFLIFLTIFCFSFFAQAHEDEHDEEYEKRQRTFLSEANQAKTGEINQEYLEKVKPIFEEKCNVCHIQNPEYPWYESIPGLGAIIRHHNEEGVEHMDLTRDYPFRGEDDLFEILEDLQEEVLEEDEMPPWYYLITHPSAGLSVEEKKIIGTWLNKARGIK